MILVHLGESSEMSPSGQVENIGAYNGNEFNLILTSRLCCGAGEHDRMVNFA